MTEALHLHVCESFEPEFCAVLAGYPDVRLHLCPLHCGRPSPDLARSEPGSPHRRWLVCARPPGDQALTPPFDQCFHLVAPATLVNEWQRQGAYVATPGWLRRWRERVDAWGFDPEGARAFFAEFARRIVLLDTGVDPDAETHLRAFGEFMNLPVERVPVGLEHLALTVESVVLRWRHQRTREELEASVKSARRRIADFALALELLRQLTGVGTEAEAIERTMEAFRVLCAPSRVSFLSLRDGAPGQLHPRGEGEATRARLASLEGDHAWHPARDGFLVRLGQRDHAVGVLELSGLMFPRHAPHYLDLTLAVSELCALAIRAARQLEEHLAQERLLHSARLESVRRLAGGMAHEFNNLLTTIRGFGELLRSACEGGHPDPEDANELLRATDRGSQLIRQLLSFSQLQVSSPAVIDLSSQVTRTGGALQRLLGDRCRLALSTPDAPRHVWIDPALLDQVLVNLTANARDAMPDGGTLRVSVTSRALRPPLPPALSDLEPVEHAVLTFSDDGQGMSPKILSRIFEPFFTTKGASRGAGLGLATVYGIVKQHRGAITVESTPGEGARFEVFFPLASEPASEPSIPPPVPARSHTGSETILVAEDEAPLNGLLRRALSAQGYRVLTARDGLEALELASQEPGVIDLLLTDVVMPRMDGRTLRDRLVAVRPGLRTVFISGYAENIVVRQGILEAGVRFLPKPFSLAVLFRELRAALEAPLTAPTE